MRAKMGRDEIRNEKLGIHTCAKTILKFFRTQKYQHFEHAICFEIQFASNSINSETEESRIHACAKTIFEFLKKRNNSFSILICGRSVWRGWGVPNSISKSKLKFLVFRRGSTYTLRPFLLYIGGRCPATFPIPADGRGLGRLELRPVGEGGTPSLD